MTRLEGLANRWALERIVDWAAGIHDFKRHHAADGTIIAETFRPMDVPADDESLFLIGLDIAWWMWVDDRSDTNLLRDTAPVDFGALIQVAAGSSGIQTADSIERQSFARLSQTMRQHSCSRDEHAWWLDSAARVFSGMEFEQERSRDSSRTSYGECVEYGLRSTAVPNIVATASIAHGLRRYVHGDCSPVSTLEGYVCAYNRLLNDLYSAEKERAEGQGGRAGNSVLQMERYLSPQRAREFVAEEMAGYQRLARGAMSRIGREELLVKLYENVLAHIDDWYRAGPVRYDTHQVSDPLACVRHDDDESPIP